MTVRQEILVPLGVARHETRQDGERPSHQRRWHDEREGGEQDSNSRQIKDGAFLTLGQRHVNCRVHSHKSDEGERENCYPQLKGAVEPERLRT